MNFQKNIWFIFDFQEFKADLKPLKIYDKLKEISWYNQNHPEAPITIHPHKFRHPTATALLRKGLSVTSTQKMLRHSNPDVTLRVYTHLSQEDLNNEFRSIIE